MPEPFKNAFNPKLVSALAQHITRQYGDFNEAAFCETIIQNLEQQELKARSQAITDQLDALLPQDYETFSGIVSGILHPNDSITLTEDNIDEHGIRGWAIMPVADLVTKRSLPHHFHKGMQLLCALTSRFSSEFAIRAFIQSEQSAALQMMLEWAKSDNEHVRRLASEGCRPRLPWEIQLKSLIADPTPLKPILIALVNDESEYVRRSVANNLNDIAKDHPDFVIRFIEQLLPGASIAQTKLCRHGARTLLKKGNAKALALFGFDSFKGNLQFSLDKQEVLLGEQINMSVNINSGIEKAQNIILDYVVWHVKANGNRTPKVFKWRSFELASFTALTINKKHAIKPVTTRKYYPGEHRIQIQVNGKVFAEQAFTLKGSCRS